MNARELADELINIANNFTDKKLTFIVKELCFVIRQQADRISELEKPLTEEEIEQCFADACTDFKLLENGTTKGIVNIIDVGREIELKIRGEK